MNPHRKSNVSQERIEALMAEFGFYWNPAAGADADLNRAAPVDDDEPVERPLSDYQRAGLSLSVACN